MKSVFWIEKLVDDGGVLQAAANGANAGCSWRR